ncbi:hypothetical protein [Streptomyces sp. NBRC 110611]|uniref:hypothetical protein n=1 Tax=Streptomyces sp. NBRC 110611 TaxID=1621259 RepID=UPI0037D9FA0F
MGARARKTALLRRIRRRKAPSAAARAAEAHAARVHADLADELPDGHLDDLGEDQDLGDFLDGHTPPAGPGADPEAHEELLEQVREARHRIARGY